MEILSGQNVQISGWVSWIYYKIIYVNKVEDRSIVSQGKIHSAWNLVNT